LITNWYWPVSSNASWSSLVAVSVVTSVDCRGSPLGLRHVLRQLRALTLWLVRVMPGSCSQQLAVVKGRPAPLIASSPPPA
jgi:hypothetical protein